MGEVCGLKAQSQNRNWITGHWPPGFRVDPFMMLTSNSLYLLLLGSAGAVRFPMLWAGNSSWRLALRELFVCPYPFGVGVRCTGLPIYIANPWPQ